MQKYANQLLFGLLLIVTIYILFLFIADNQLQLEGDASIGVTLGMFQWGLLPALVATQTVVLFFRCVTWTYWMRVIGAHDKISLFDSLVLFIASFTMVVSPGKAAEVLKSVLLKTKTGIPIARSVPVVLAERIIDGLAVIIIMAGTLWIAGDLLNLGSYGDVDYGALSRFITYTSLAVIVGGLIVVQIRALAYFFLELLGKLPLLRRLQEPLTTFYESSREIFRLRHVIPMAGVGLGVYLPSALTLILVLAGFGVEITWAICLQATFIVGVTSAIGALSFVPNGAGITEVSTVGMLLAFVAPADPAITPAVAAAASLLQGFFHKWFRVLVGLIVAIVFRKRLFSDAFKAEVEALSHQPAH